MLRTPLLTYGRLPKCHCRMPVLTGMQNESNNHASKAGPIRKQQSLHSSDEWKHQLSKHFVNITELDTPIAGDVATPAGSFHTAVGDL